MSKLIVAVAAIALMCGAATTLAQCDDPFDQTLCVYTLTPTEEATFSSVDGAVSGFWDSWGGRDYAELIYPDDCYPDRCGFTGTGDAGLIIKAAGTGKGIYLYLAVQDNVWVDRSAADDIGADATDLFFDSMSPDDIFTCTDCLVGLYSTTLTYTTQQFQVWMGATAPPTGFNYQHYDEQLWSWQAMGLTWQAAEVLYGFKAEVITVDGTHKTQEWFFPWEKFGQGIPVGTDLGNRHVSLSGGYNDKDGDNPTNDCLRWTGKDPWAGDAQTVNYWGDMVLAADMGTVQQVVSTIPQVAGRSGSVASSSVAHTDYFNLQGARLATSAVNALPVGSMVLKRITMRDGSQKADMIRVTR
jgi:hypothetical protein